MKRLVWVMMAVSAVAAADPPVATLEPALAPLKPVSALALLPRGAECVGQMDVAAFARWGFSGRFLEAMPQFVPQLRRVGMFPLAGVRTVSGAASRTGDKQGEAVFVIEADGPRAEWTALGDGRFAAGAPRPLGDLVRRAKRGVGTRSSLGDVVAGLNTGASRGACLVTPTMKLNARKEWPEIDSADRLFFTLDFDTGFRMAATIIMTSEAAATSLLTRMQAAIAKMKNGMGGMFNIRGMLQPLQLRRNGARIEMSYAMTPPLLEQALSMMRLMRDLSESSGDSVR